MSGVRLQGSGVQGLIVLVDVLARARSRDRLVHQLSRLQSPLSPQASFDIEGPIPSCRIPTTAPQDATKVGAGQRRAADGAPTEPRA